MNEINNLFLLSVKNGISILFLKRIILASDLYKPYYLRKSEDIDIYVDCSRLHLMDKLMRESGYYVLNEDTYTNSFAYVSKYETIRNELNHLMQYHKSIETKEGEVDFIIDVDLHIFLFH